MNPNNIPAAPSFGGSAFGGVQSSSSTFGGAATFGSSSPFSTNTVNKPTFGGSGFGSGGGVGSITSAFGAAAVNSATGNREGTMSTGFTA